MQLLFVFLLSFVKGPKAVTPHHQLDDISDAGAAAIGRVLSVGDSVFGLDVQQITGDNQVLGVEFVGGYFFLSGGNSLANPNKIYKVSRDGTLIGSYDQPTTSSWGFRDLASDGDYIYGTDDDGKIYQIDASTVAPTGVVINGPLSVNRALAYDPAHDRFWTANFRSDIYEFDRNGNVINIYPNQHYVYGMAWDDISPGGPWLWVATQDYSSGYYNVIYKFDPRTGTYTGDGMVIPYGFLGGHAGGLTFTTDLVMGKAVLVEIIQENDASSPNHDILVAIEIADMGPPHTPMPPEGITAYSDCYMPNAMLLRWNDPTHYTDGTRLRNFEIEILDTDSTLVATVPSGVESTIIEGLTDGVEYQFLLRAVDSAGAMSVLVPSPWWYAGGSPWPAPPTDVAWHYVDDSTVTITWHDPTTQSDGTPLDDLLGIYIYLDDTLYDSAYAGYEHRTMTVVPGAHTVYLRAFDAEPERHLSIPSDTIRIFTTGHRVGPDAFGYHLLDSYIEDSVQFEWTEISSYGQRLDIGDDDMARVSLPFMLPFYDTAFTEIFVNSNGGITFSPSDTLSPTNQQIPSDGLPVCVVPLWTDLNPEDAPQDGGVFVAQAGSDFVIEWKDVPLYQGDGRYTFEVVIHPNGWFDFHYLSVPRDFTSEFTIGMFASAENRYLQYSFNGEPIVPEDSLSVRIIRPPFHDVGVATISPSDTTLWPGVPVSPEVSVVNFSENTETVSVTVSVLRNSTVVFSDTTSVEIQPYASADAVFGDWIPSPQYQDVDYEIEAEILTPDSNPSNNSSSAIVHVAPVSHDSVAVPLALTTPVIDGQISSAEWEDATQIQLTDGGTNGATVYLKHDDANLYIAVDVPFDLTQDANDKFAFFVDDNGDFLWPTSASDTSEGGNSISIGWQWATRPMTFQQFYDWGYPRNDMAGNYFISYNSGHYQAELRVPINLYEPDPAHIAPALDSTFNIMFEYLDHDSVVGWWPHGLRMELCEYPITYGRVVLMPFNPGVEEGDGRSGLDISINTINGPAPYLVVRSSKEITAELSIIDVAGRKLKARTLRLQNGVTRIGLSDLADGIYFVELRTGSMRINRKILVVR